MYEDEGALENRLLGSYCWAFYAKAFFSVLAISTSSSHHGCDLLTRTPFSKAVRFAKLAGNQVIGAPPLCRQKNDGNTPKHPACEEPPFQEIHWTCRQVYPETK